MAPKTPSKTTQVTEVKLPKWVQSASKDNYEYAKRIAAKDQKVFQGDRVADLNPLFKQAFANYQSNAGGMGEYDKAGAGYDALLKTRIPQVGTNFNTDRITSQDVTAGKLTPEMIQQYMNPYLDEVVNKSMGALEDSRVQSLMANAEKAKAAGAFGGSRAAVIDAITNSETAKQAGILSAGLRSDAFNNATGLATTDLNRAMAAAQSNQQAALSADQSNQQAGIQEFLARLTGEQSNQQAALSKGQLNLSALAGLKDLGGLLDSRRQQDFATQAGYASALQQQKQQEINARMQKFNEVNSEDENDLNLRLSALGMSPYGKSESSTKTHQDGGGTDFASVGLGIISLLPMLFGLSDREEKTDIKKLGKDPSTGLPLYAFRYKGDPKSYPKVVGPMAQDIEKMFPDKVKKIGKARVVEGMGRG